MISLPCFRRSQEEIKTDGDTDTPRRALGQENSLLRWSPFGMRNVETFCHFWPVSWLSLTLGISPEAERHVFYLHGKHHIDRLLFCGKLCELNRAHSAEAGGEMVGKLRKNLFPSAGPPAPSLRYCYRSSTIKDPKEHGKWSQKRTSHLNVGSRSPGE